MIVNKIKYLKKIKNIYVDILFKKYLLNNTFKTVNLYAKTYIH